MHPRSYRLAPTPIVALALVAAASVSAQDAPPEINKPFQNPDVAEYIKKFESESREIYIGRAAIAQAAGVKPGMAVADVGAGTGLFTRLFAERVGPEGKVYAVDIAEAFLRHIAEGARKQEQRHVQTILGTQETTNLPPDAVDLAFLCDVYHHLERHEPVLASIHRALRPGGRLVVIEFDRREGVSSDFILKHVRANKAQFLAEITAAGFEPVETPDAPALKENFFAAFRRVERRDKAQ
jgi:ubiquinone/menaquinone biosynthesis C-methylase UbiE